MPIWIAPTCRAAAVLVVLAAPALAQSSEAPPARNGNVWNGRRHPPDPAAVQSGEQAAGVAVDPSKAQRETDEVEQLNDQLQQRAKQDTQTAPAP